ncbi:hypothetical protein [Neptuniibacter pectenicola]|uniref:hypothetical protein n=1 Tax=Neptuniibacter pectenicola TaxID=1806669 RepID=UPI000836817C|nr:hypothetical protein [Neptuniibacter pectenicola]
MIFRAWISIIVMAVCVWSVWVGLDGKIPPYEYAPVSFVFHWVTPWLLLILAAKSWYRIFIWERMLQARQSPPILSRGLSTQAHKQTNTDLLKLTSQALFLFASAGVLNHFSIDHIEWWITLIITCFYLLKKSSRAG